ncbi:hypothetical protein CL658_02515 [bacterium]|nr:hypothetical protein [bacterium]
MYCRFPRLTLLDSLYIIEEAFRFFLLPIRLIIGLFLPKHPYRPVYGTISFAGINQLATVLPIDHYRVCDIGSGKGKLLFFLSIVYKCNCIGIESYRPYTFIHRCFSFLLGLSRRVRLIHDTITHRPLPHADVYFILGLGFEPETLAYVQDQLKLLVKTRIVISVGVLFPSLADYHKDTLSIPCSWGYCDTYIYHCIDSTDKA